MLPPGRYTITQPFILKEDDVDVFAVLLGEWVRVVKPGHCLFYYRFQIPFKGAKEQPPPEAADLKNTAF